MHVRLTISYTVFIHDAFSMIMFDNGRLRRANRVDLTVFVSLSFISGYTVQTVSTCQSARPDLSFSRAHCGTRMIFGFSSMIAKSLSKSHELTSGEAQDKTTPMPVS
jgi:hypothetical protein